MSASFILSCESTVDLPYSYIQERGIPVLFYTYLVDGKEYIDDMGRDPEALPTFYRLLQEGHLPTTSQLNLQTYLDYFETLLPKGDVLHIAFGSGMTNSVRSSRPAYCRFRISMTRLLHMPAETVFAHCPGCNTVSCTIGIILF